jgi:hypothetical protein
MTKTALLKKLEAMLTTAEQERMWGNLEIEIRNGVAVVIRKSTTEKLETTENNRGQRYER